MRTCATCKDEKTLDSFSWRNKAKGLLQSHCKNCVAVKNKTQYENNKEDKIRYQTEWKKNNPEKVKAYEQKYRDENKDKIKVLVRKWDVANRGRRVAITNKYRAAKLSATPIWLTHKHHEAILAVYNEAAEKGYHVDHIVPLQGETVCGLHVPWNLQILPPSENCSKGNRFAQS